MIELPDTYKNKTINRYKQKGEEWINNIEAIIEKYQNKFQLEDIKLIENLSINIVLFAKSYKYGDIVMKIGTPGKTSIAEINIMKYYPSEYVPKCYYSNLEDRVMLLEKVNPGYNLSCLNNIEERVKVFSNIAKNLLVQPSKEDKFTTFEEKLKEDFEYAHNNKQAYSNIMELINIADSVYKKIKKRNLKKYVIHEDLNYKNILKAKKGWKAIDPHGVIGEKVIETSQFIREEIKRSNLEQNSIDEIISLLCKYFNEDRNLILEVLYVYIISKIIHYIRSKDSNSKISYNIDVAKKILSLL